MEIYTKPSIFYMKTASEFRVPAKKVEVDWRVKGNHDDIIREKKKRNRRTCDTN